MQLRAAQAFQLYLIRLAAWVVARINKLMELFFEDGDKPFLGFLARVTGLFMTFDRAPPANKKPFFVCSKGDEVQHM
jgi:hypothetical protein